MADSMDRSGPDGHALVVGAAVGALVGAAGLAWWLLERSARKRRLRAHRQLSLFQPGDGAQVRVGAERDARLQQRVRQLNEAIEEVRRQLEDLHTDSSGASPPAG